MIVVHKAGRRFSAIDPDRDATFLHPTIRDAQKEKQANARRKTM
jgi:hypothetical protein